MRKLLDCMDCPFGALCLWRKKQRQLVHTLGSDPNVFHGHQNFYELTSKGKDFAKSECDIKHFISNNNASVHNSAVSKFMVDHLSRAELESVRSERELSVFLESRLNEYYNNERDQYEELLQTMQEHKLSMPDFIYTTSAGETIAVEIVTSSYSQEDIDLKIETASLLKIQIEIVQA